MALLANLGAPELHLVLDRFATDGIHFGMELKAENTVPKIDNRRVGVFLNIL